MNFNSYYDGPVRAAALLVNALTGGEMRGRPYPMPQGEKRIAAITEALAAASDSVRGITAPEAEELAEVATAVRAVFTATAGGDVDSAAEQVNALLDTTGAQPRLERHGGQSWHLHYHGTAGTLAAQWAGTCAAGLAVVLGSDHRDRLGVCTAPRCDRVYVDTSHNGTRRFCSTACQNRVKTAAFRARAQSTATRTDPD